MYEIKVLTTKLLKRIAGNEFSLQFKKKQVTKLLNCLMLVICLAL
jgi:hypothetical protein